MQWDQMSLEWFDLAVAAVLLYGVYRGRRNGMSEELLPLLQWLLILVVGSYTYALFGDFLHLASGLHPNFCRAAVYALDALLIKWLCDCARHGLGDKLVSSDVFGQSEYVFGMAAGALRHACRLVFFMALISAPYISEAKRAANARMQRENFGVITFPTFGSIQHAVLRESWTGRLVTRHLSNLLIESVPTPGRSQPNTPAHRRERAVDQVLEPK
ncbi:MAG: CvpA family protein [Verrucomicrobia bacterium]|nr:CvpA family protein [Verrucomicrobiota bacterium]